MAKRATNSMSGSAIVVDDAMRERLKRKLLAQMARMGFAYPGATLVQVRDAEREILQQMVVEGVAHFQRRRADRYGFLNPRGRSWTTVYVPAEPAEPQP